MYVYILKDGIKFDGEARPYAMPIFILDHTPVTHLSLYKQFKQMGWKLRISEGNHPATHKQIYYVFLNSTPSGCFLAMLLFQFISERKMKILDILLMGGLKGFALGIVPHKPDHIHFW